MRSKAAFIVGTGVGYVLGTRAGRQRFDKIKGWTSTAWQHPKVQAKVTDLEAKAADLARSEVAALKGRVTESVRTAVGSSKGVAPEPIERHATAPAATDGDPGVPLTPYPVQGSTTNGTNLS
jgi:hypothetical protein